MKITHFTYNAFTIEEGSTKIAPKLVIPCHYNVPYSFIKNVSPADDLFFRDEVLKMGMDCKILANGDLIEL